MNARIYPLVLLTIKRTMRTSSKGGSFGVEKMKMTLLIKNIYLHLIKMVNILNNILTT